MKWRTEVKVPGHATLEEIDSIVEEIREQAYPELDIGQRKLTVEFEVEVNPDLPLLGDGVENAVEDGWLFDADERWDGETPLSPFQAGLELARQVREVEDRFAEHAWPFERMGVTELSQ